MLSSIKEFHEARLLKETQELEKKAGADNSLREEAMPDERYDSAQQHCSPVHLIIEAVTLTQIFFLIRQRVLLR